MSTETIVKPPQPIRRRESSRPLLGKRGADTEIQWPATKRPRTLQEPYVRDSQYILRKHKGKAPSLKLHLHATHFRFDGQDGSFAYDSPMRFVLKHLQTQTVPHDMLEELLASNVPFYDGCLIVEVHNYRQIEGKQNGTRVARDGEDHKKFSIHNWNLHVTPSAGASFPDKSQLEPDAASVTEESGVDGEVAPKVKSKDEPVITTIVLHPTEQTRHEETLILARTPQSDIRRKRGSDGSVPPTPALSMPPTPSGSTGKGAAHQKMALDQAALYAFQGEALAATEPPLLLEPPESAEHAFQLLDSLKHPLHSGRPPAAKERKRTTAEMAADDAQAAESERRMLIMDERIKPSARSGAGANSGDNQTSAASLGFSRFKTIENVKQRLEEQDRLKKEKEALAVQEKRQQEEAAAQQRLIQQQQQQQQHHQQQQQQAVKQREAQDAQARHRQMLLQQQQQQQQQQKHANQVNTHALAQAQQQAELMKQMAQQNLMQNAHQMSNGVQAQNGGFQGSTMPAQQTPLMAHSSPMVGQNGFPMVPNSSQGAGSPPRPTSAALVQPNGVGMSRGASQQTHTSLHNTPHVPQSGTPALPNAVPNRSMNQTPHLNPSSPMVGTPNPNMALPNARLNGNLDTAQQNLLMQQMQQHSQQNGGQTMANGQVNMAAGSSMTPEQFQMVRQMSRLSEFVKNTHSQAQQAANQGNQSMAAQLMARAQNAQQQYAALRMRLLGPGGNHTQGTPNANHAQMNGVNGHMNQVNGNVNGQQQANNAAMLNAQAQQAGMQPGQTLTVQQQQNFMRSQQDLRRLLQVHQGNIPANVIATLQPGTQMLLRQHQQRQQQQLQAQAQARNQAQVQAQAQARMGMQMGGQGSPQSAAQNAQYMQNMQALRNGLAMQMQGQQANGQGMNGNMGMNMANMQQFVGARQQNQQGNAGGDLTQQFAAMHDAISRGNGLQ